MATGSASPPRRRETRSAWCPLRPKTIRAGMCPASTSAIASLTSASGLSRGHRRLPRRVELEHLAQVGPRAHDRADDGDPVQHGLEDRELISFSAASATKTSVPPRRSDRYACSNDAGRTASAIAWSAPPSRWIASAGSSFAALTVNSAPSSVASSSFSSTRSTATTRPPAIARVLDREVAEPADAEDRDEVGRTRARDLDRLVRRDAGARERRGVERVDRRRAP